MMAEVMFLSTDVNELFAIEQLFATPGQALAWTEEHIELVTLAKKPDTAKYIAQLKLSLASADIESQNFAMMMLTRLIEAQAAWLQGKPIWSAIGRKEALKTAVAAIRDSEASPEEHESIKASFLSEHRKATERIEQNRPGAETTVAILSDQAFVDWAYVQLKEDWNRSIIARCGHDVERWALVAPNSLKIMANTLKDLRRQYDALLLRPNSDRKPARRQPVKKPGSAARRHPRIAKNETSSTEPATANSDKGLSAKATRAKSKKG